MSVNVVTNRHGYLRLRIFSRGRDVAVSTRYRDDGRIEIDNNCAERALRGVSLGRKNYLFMGSDAGGERACRGRVRDGVALNQIRPARRRPVN